MADVAQITGEGFAFFHWKIFKGCEFQCCWACEQEWIGGAR